jgi:AcrR family transcriptional regulator
VSHTPCTVRGARTRARLLAAAEQVFESVDYHEASVARITETAGTGLGTFYLYFAGKQEIFDEVVEDLNRRVRHAMARAAAVEETRSGAERAGFRAFFRFTAEHPALYRIIRQAEFVSPGALRLHYTRIVEACTAGLRAAQAAGEVRPMDPEVAAWALMGIGEMVGLRWVLWEAGTGAPADGSRELPEHVLDEVMEFVGRALAPGSDPASTAQHPADGPREDRREEDAAG